MQPKRKGIFKRGWGHKSSAEKQVKPSKSKLGDGSAALPHKSAGAIIHSCYVHMSFAKGQYIKP